jgi:hypothetical protein
VTDHCLRSRHYVNLVPNQAELPLEAAWSS